MTEAVGMPIFPGLIEQNVRMLLYKCLSRQIVVTTIETDVPLPT
jgi:hypothetical protein